MQASRVIIIVALALLISARSLAQQPPPNASIEGIVLRADTGAPLANARVTLSLDIPRGRPIVMAQPNGDVLPAEELEAPPPFGPQGNEGVSPNIPPVSTDAQGRFAFANLSPGAYRLQAQSNGYVPAAHGQRQAGGPGTPITLVDGQKFSDAVMRLTPAGNISGRIRDLDDQPLAGIPVEALRATYDSSGRQILQSAGRGRTNDRGEYRIFWVSPGRYFLRAGAAGNSMQPFMAVVAASLGRPGALNPNELPADTAVTFYPGVSDVSGARTVELLPGGELAGIDWALPPQRPTYNVRVRIIDAKTNQPPPQAEVAISSTTADPTRRSSLAARLESSFSPGYNPATGIEDLGDAEPGAYLITATSGRTRESAFSFAFPDPERAENLAEVPPPLTGSAVVTVSDSNVENVVIAIAPAGVIQGRVRFEGEVETAQVINFQLVEFNKSLTEMAYFGGGVADGTRNKDGTYRFVPFPGEYRVNVYPLNRNTYIKEARLDGLDVLGAPLIVRGPTSGTLDVLISANGGQIQGTLLDDKSAPVPVTQVTLVPDRGRNRADLFKTVVTDANGRFTFNAVPPGSYKVFSWEVIERYSWFDANVLERSESRATPVTVAESAVETVEVKIIPRGAGQ
jgi:protocatechuate 3,4-dioxygenase beta subunit